MEITLIFKYLNSSTQVGDEIYFTNTVVAGGFNTGSLDTTKKLGIIKEIEKEYVANQNTNKYKVLIDHFTALGHSQVGVSTNSFFMFSKNNEVNLTSLVGYYAKVNFINNSKEKAELFAVSSEIVQSSK
tara:strand:+ start:6501 stop:6887 length:387 start_codon:yes stop_codon:yes gene_type:complete